MMIELALVVILVLIMGADVATIMLAILVGLGLLVLLDGH